MSKTKVSENIQNTPQTKQVEHHPLKPFLPTNTKLLMLGSFPPPRSKWGMDFYYPNFINDMWRIFGLVFFKDKGHFLLDDRHFDKAKIEAFLNKQGIGVADSVSEAIRLKDNASDNFLQVVKPTNLYEILKLAPKCSNIITAGEKSTNETLASLGMSKIAKNLKLGESVNLSIDSLDGRNINLYRLPSSSRAYPLKLEKKAEFYAKVFSECKIL